MGFIDYVVWGAVGLVVGGSIGAGCAKLAVLYLRKVDKDKVTKVIEGKIPNTLKLDGEIIQVDKFKYKKGDGKIVEVKLEELAQVK